MPAKRRDAKRTDAKVLEALKTLGPDASREDIKRYCGLRSASSVFDSLKRLEREGVYDPDTFTITDKVRVEGIFPSTGLPDGWEAIGDMAEKQGDVEKRIEERYNQQITIEDGLPVAVALFSDLHFGGPHCDYKSIKRDTELVAKTKGFYGIAAGDYADNWIGKLGYIQREQAVSYKTEIAMVEAWFEKLDGDLLCVVSGNHDNRTIIQAGIDNIRRILRGAQLLYDTDEVVFDLNLGDAAWTFKVRHDWMGKSIYNPTHGIERDPKFGDGAFDIGIGGHIHRGCLFREFVIHNRRRLAVMLGTYKLLDRYSLKLGFPRSPETPSGALILYPDGRLWHTQDLQTAADFVTWERSRARRKKR